MWTACGTAPPRLARTVVPQYSPSLRASTITASGLEIASRTSRHVASACASRRPVHSLAGGGPASRVTGSPARVHAPNPPSSTRTDGWPKYSRNQNARAARTPDCSSYATIGVDGVDAVDCEHVLDHPHERVERRRIGVGQAQTPQIDLDRPGDVPGDVGVRGAQVEDQRSGRLRPLELGGQLARCNQQLRVGVPFHSRNRTTGASRDHSSTLASRKASHRRERRARRGFWDGFVIGAL